MLLCSTYFPIKSLIYIYTSIQLYSSHCSLFLFCFVLYNRVKWQSVSCWERLLHLISKQFVHRSVFMLHLENPSSWIYKIFNRRKFIPLFSFFTIYVWFWFWFKYNFFFYYNILILRSSVYESYGVLTLYYELPKTNCLISSNFYIRNCYL